MNQLQERIRYKHIGGAAQTVGHQELMPLHCAAFHVTVEFLQVTIRP